MSTRPPFSRNVLTNSSSEDFVFINSLYHKITDIFREEVLGAEIEHRIAAALKVSSLSFQIVKFSYLRNLSGILIFSRPKVYFSLRFLISISECFLSVVYMFSHSGSGHRHEDNKDNPSPPDLKPLQDNQYSDCRLEPAAVLREDRYCS